MGFGVLGINHHLAPVTIRSVLAEIASRRFRADTDESLILLSTCNRIEIYFSSPVLSCTHAYLLEILKKECSLPFDQLLYTFFGKSCLQHLVRVTSGLDSAILGETEIQGQVKRAYTEASLKQELPFDLHFLFQKSLQAAKKIRSRHLQGGAETTLAREVETLLDSNLAPGTPLLLVGASETNHRIALQLLKKKKYPFFLSNRSSLKGEKLSRSLRCPHVPWREWNSFKAFIFATTALEPLLDQEDTFLKDGASRLLIDLGVPQNIDPRLKNVKGVSLFDIDDVQKIGRSQGQEEERLWIETEIQLLADNLYPSFLERKDRFPLSPLL